MNEPLSRAECASVAADLEAYCDGELRPAERAAVDRHLATCEECRAEVALLLLVTRSLRQAARPEPSERMRQRLLAQVSGDLAPRRMEIFCIERHGQQVTRRDEVRHCQETPGCRLPARKTTPAVDRRLQKTRRVSTSGSGRLCVIANDYIGT